jgi:CHAT domain-containing protein
LDEAHIELERATSSDDVNRVALLSANGELLARSGNFSGAESLFTQAASAARAANDPLDEAREQLNALRARLDRQELAELNQRLQTASRLVWSVPPGEDAAVLLLAVGDLHRRAVNEFRSSTALRAEALRAFSRARELAESDATRGYAIGLLGALYLDEGRFEESMRLTTQAIFIAQSAVLPDQLYRWEWQAERAQRNLGNAAAAESSADRALEELDPIRNDVLRSSRQAYRSLIEPVYLDSADIKLQRAGRMTAGSEEQQHLLRDVRDRLESLKQAEIQDYFERACIASSTTPQLQGAAIIYPILLPERLEVLIDADGTLRRFVTPVGRGEVTTSVRRARSNFERPNSGTEYLEPAQKLYRWILQEADPWLQAQHVHTLVFVPAGPLRTIPLGALHDGHQFLIERYAVATTPAVSLLTGTSSAPIKRVLIGGLSKSVQGFPELPRVVDEIHSIAAEYPAQPLQDESFRMAAVSAGLSASEFSAVHLATHGEFSADHRQSFVLTYDNRLTLDNLQDALGRRADSPLDLLVLSACRTAAGDDRAALGLAGVAVQAGARSALASLWYVSDEASAALMADFYRRLKEGKAGKAESLREAQQALLRDPKYRHPSYWAPYLLIGNWG